MPNLRIVYDNALTRHNTLAASTVAGTLVVENLLTDTKSAVWRSTVTSATLTVTWAATETIGCVAMPFCNFTSSATIRVRCYTNVGDGSPVFDSTPILACPYVAPPVASWGNYPAGVNSFSYGGAVYACAWFDEVPCKKIVIDLADGGNSDGYIEASRLVLGGYWSPAINPSYGAALAIQDTSKHFRNDAGDLMTDVGARSRKLTMSLNDMRAADRAQLTNILRGNGLTMPIFVSLFPEDSDTGLEAAHQIYGKLSSLSAITITGFDRYALAVELEEV